MLFRTRSIFTWYTIVSSMWRTDCLFYLYIRVFMLSSCFSASFYFNIFGHETLKYMYHHYCLSILDFESMLVRFDGYVALDQ